MNMRRRLGVGATLVMTIGLLTAVVSTPAGFANERSAAPTSTSTSTTSTTDGDTTSTLAACYGPSPGTFDVEPRTLAPGQAVVVSGSGIWLTTTPNPDPSLCPLPVGFNGPATATLDLAPDGTADAPAVALGQIDLFNGDGSGRLTIPASITYRGPATIAVTYADSQGTGAIAPVTIVDPAASSTAAPATPVTNQPQFTG